MDRLTDIINGWTFEETIKTAESLMEAEKNMFKWDVLRHLRDFAENYREQIKEYQQLEEQGRLVKLPCKYVYYIVDINNPKYAMVMKRTIRELAIYEIEDIDKENCKYFSVEEKAEAKLKELRGGENGSME